MDAQIKAEVKKSSNLTSFFVKLDRVAAWVLLLVLLAYAVTGYGMTKGFIGQELARSLHLGWLGAIGLIAFVIHTYHAINLAFKRWCICNKISNFFLILAYILLIGFFVFLQFFYSSSKGENFADDKFSDNQLLGANIDMASLPVYNVDTLAVYNGLNGQPAYAAVDGLVYDFSRVFRGGRHHGYSAGQDLTEAFYSEHSRGILSGYTIVGTYK